MAVVALGSGLGGGLGGVIAIQWAFAALAAAAQYELGRQLGGPRVGLLSAGFVIANPDIGRWHAFILTDSLYISFVILTIWAVHRASVGPTRGRLALALVLTAATALIRPNGWIMLPIVLAYLSRRLIADRRVGRLSAVATAVAFVAIAAAFPPVRNAIQAERPGVMLRRGEVVWGYPAWRAAMPADRAPAGAGWPAAVGYVGRHPLACLRLAGLRVLAELSHVRPFYSARHNDALLIGLPLFYLLAVVGFVQARRRALGHLLAAVVVGHVLIIALTFADWDGRFLLYFLPALAVFAAAGVASFTPGSRPRSRSAAA